MAADLRDRVSSFVELLERLVARLDDPAASVLHDLIAALDYRTHLREQSVRPEQGEARVRTLEAFLRYADSYETPTALLQAVRSLAAAHESQRETAPVTVRSIHRAKGAEWPVVFVPGGVEGTLPHTPEEKSEEALAEERRLFYVALTRTQEHLYLGTHSDEDRSRFLTEADVEETLSRCRTVRTVLRTAPDELTEKDVARLCHALGMRNLESFIRDAWTPTTSQREALRSHLSALPSAVADAKRRVEDAEEARREHEAASAGLREEISRRVDQLRATIGTAPLSVLHEAPETYYPDDACFTFAWNQDESAVLVYRADTSVGRIDPLGAGRLDPETVFAAPWTAMVGRFEGVARGRTRLRLTIDWEETSDRLLAQKREALSGPEPPDAYTQLLTSDAVRAGYELLQDRLADRPPH